MFCLQRSLSIWRNVRSLTIRRVFLELFRQTNGSISDALLSFVCRSGIEVYLHKLLFPLLVCVYSHLSQEKSMTFKKLNPRHTMPSYLAIVALLVVAGVLFVPANASVSFVALGATITITNNIGLVLLAAILLALPLKWLVARLILHYNMTHPKP